MSEHASGSGGSDIWWFLGIMAMLFILWVALGGPQRAEQDNPKPFIYGPYGGTHATSTTPTPVSGQIQVQPI